MISSAISADLGRQEALRGSQQALATVTGIVDGTGSIGAAFGQVKKNTHTSRGEIKHLKEGLRWISPVQIDPCSARAVTTATLSLFILVC